MQLMIGTLSRNSLLNLYQTEVFTVVAKDFFLGLLKRNFDVINS